MKWWLTAWQLVRDVACTGTGLWLILSQVGAREPSSTLIVAGLALLAPAATEHVKSVLSGPSGPHGGPGSSSSPSSPESPSPATPPPEGTGEGAEGPGRTGMGAGEV